MYSPATPAAEPVARRTRASLVPVAHRTRSSRLAGIVDAVVPSGPVPQRSGQSSSPAKRPMRGGPGTGGYITIVVPGVDLVGIVNNMAKTGHSCAYEAMQQSCIRECIVDGKPKKKGGSTFSVENISSIVRRIGWPDHSDGAPLTAEMVVAAHMYDPKDKNVGPWYGGGPTPIGRGDGTHCQVEGPCPSGIR